MTVPLAPRMIGFTANVNRTQSPPSSVKVGSIRWRHVRTASTTHAATIPPPSTRLNWSALTGTAPALWFTTPRWR